MTSRSLLPFDPEAVRPWQLGEGGRGVLLLHGFAGTPPELRRLGEHLAAHGWRCRAPAMAGHGTTPEDHARVRWTDWANSAQAALDELHAGCDAVAVAGQSMGGAMALHLAARDPRVGAVAALATPLRLHDWRLRYIALLKHVQRWHFPDPDDIDLYSRSAAEELHSYGRRSTKSIHQLVLFLRRVRDDLPMIRQPVLLLHGGRDRAVPADSMPEIARRLRCSLAVETRLLPRSGHAISVDVDRAEVNARVLAWFDRYLPSGFSRREARRDALPSPRR